jgi:hypothetical protein
MRRSAFAFVVSALLVIGFAASTGAKKPTDPGPPDVSAIFASGIECFESSAGVVVVTLGRVGASVEGGSVIGVPASFGFGGLLSVSAERSGTCDEAVSALAAQLPSPLCSTGPVAFGSFQFVCSGEARSVLEAVGELAKSILSP